MKNEAEITAWHKELIRLSHAERYTDVIASVRARLAGSPDNIEVTTVAVAFLIDAGNCLGDLSAIVEARQVIQGLIARSSPDARFIASQKYYLSNTFASERRILHARGEHDKAQEAVTEQKQLLQELLLQEGKLSVDLRVRVHTNCANALDEGGRTVEAIDHFVQAWSLDRNHMLAKGNCGVALVRLARIGGNHAMRNRDAGLRLLEEACAAPREILRYASPSAVTHLEEQLGVSRREIDQRVKDASTTLEDWRIHRQEAHGTPKCAPHLKLVLKDRLLLSLNQFPLASEEEAVDDLMFGQLSSGIDEESVRWSVEIIHRLNVLKEEFVSARYLYYLSAEEPAPNLVAAEAATRYADPGYATEFSIASGMLKASFRTAVDILDKVAFFLATYLKLGHRDNRIYFRTVWYLNCDEKRGEHPLVTETKKRNTWLRALNELQGDWFADRFPGPFQEIRHIGTHRGLILSSGDDGGLAPPGARSVDEHRADTLLMLRCVKAALIYLVLFIDHEESKRSHGDKKVGVMPLLMRGG
jgi:tetratricopeptide (TPR) repeat protein